MFSTRVVQQPELKLIKSFVGRRQHKLFRGLWVLNSDMTICKLSDGVYYSRKESINGSFSSLLPPHAYHMPNLTKTTAYLNSLYLIWNSKWGRFKVFKPMHTILSVFWVSKGSCMESGITANLVSHSLVLTLNGATILHNFSSFKDNRDSKVYICDHFLAESQINSLLASRLGLDFTRFSCCSKV